MNDKINKISIKPDQQTASSFNSGWRNPSVDVPPKGVKLQLYTEGGIAVYGHWKDSAGFLAWAPLPAVPKWLKTLEKESYLKNSTVSSI